MMDSEIAVGDEFTGRVCSVSDLLAVSSYRTVEWQTRT